MTNWLYVEWGFKACERGLNLEGALIEFNALMATNDIKPLPERDKSKRKFGYTVDRNGKMVVGDITDELASHERDTSEGVDLSGFVISAGDMINGPLTGKLIPVPITRRCHWMTGSDGLTMTLHIGGKRLGHVKRANGDGWQWHCGLPGIARNDMHGKTAAITEARAAVERVCLKWFEDVDREIVS